MEEGGKLYSFVHKRLHEYQGRDLKILADLNFEWLPDKYPYEAGGAEGISMKQDFDGRIDILPVSDPNMPTQSHRIARANAIYATAIQLPQDHNMPEVIKYIYEAMGEENPDRFLKPKTPPAEPLDPISENMNVMKGIPLKAGDMQHHEAHMKAHFTFSQMPNVRKNQQAMGILMAHIQEHVALDYRNKIQQAIGQPLPPPGQPIPPEIEMELSMAVASVSDEILQSDVLDEIMNDPAMVVALEGVEMEREKNTMNAKMDLMEIQLKEVKKRLDDENKDLDREKDVEIALLQLQGRNKNG